MLIEYLWVATSLIAEVHVVGPLVLAVNAHSESQNAIHSHHVTHRMRANTGWLHMHLQYDIMRPRGLPKVACVVHTRIPSSSCKHLRGEQRVTKSPQVLHSVTILPPDVAAAARCLKAKERKKWRNVGDGRVHTFCS